MRRLNWIKVFIAMVLLAGAIYFCIYSINSLQSKLKNPITGDVISQGQDSGYGNLDSNSAVGKINLKDKDGEEVEAKINYLNGKKDIEIIPKQSPIKKIVLHDVNLSENETGLIYYLNISKAASEVNLTLNESDSNISANLGEIINITATMIIPSSGNVDIYEDNSEISSGGAPLSTTVSYSGAGEHNITAVYNGNDNYTFSFETHWINVTAELIPPTPTAVTPANNSIDGDGNVYFTCNATDNANLKNISLIFNDAINQTQNVNGTSNQSSFNITGLANDNYNWSCQACDSSHNCENYSLMLLTVDTNAIPNSTNYTGGNTTNWSEVPDLTNVCNGTAVIDMTDGSVRWWNCVNASYQNFDTNVNLTYNFVDLTFGLNPTFNSSAQIVFEDLPWDSTPEILMDGVICDPSTCQNVTYDNATGILVFNATHFTNFTTVGNSRLIIWDQNDTGMPGGDNPACEGSQINFFANYSRTANGNPITGATCIINFTDSLGNSMTYNGTSTYYDYNRTFNSLGTKNYNINCSKTGAQMLVLTDSIIMTDCSAPNSTLVLPANGNLTNLTTINFNCNATDNIELKNNTFYWNASGAWNENGTENVSGTNNLTTFSRTISNGKIIWNCLACDNSSLCSFAPANYTITIDSDIPLIEFENPTENSSTIVNRTYLQVNVTASDTLSLKNITINLYNSTDLLRSNATTTSPNFINYTGMSDGLYYFNATAYDDAGNINSTETRNVTIDTAAPNVTIISPTNITYTDTLIWFNATANEAINNWILNYNGTNLTITINSTIVVQEGTWHLILYANDTGGNIGLNNSTWFSVNTTTTPSGPSGGGGGGGGITACTENWLCSEFSSCVDGMQTRTCTDLNNCGTSLNKPAETISCEALPFWQNNLKDRDETDIDCGGSQAPKCSDGKSCLVNNDCLSNNCYNSTCLAAGMPAEKPITIISEEITQRLKSCFIWIFLLIAILVTYRLVTEYARPEVKVNNELRFYLRKQQGIAKQIKKEEKKIATISAIEKKIRKEPAKERIEIKKEKEKERAFRLADVFESITPKIKSADEKIKELEKKGLSQRQLEREETILAEGRKIREVVQREVRPVEEEKALEKGVEKRKRTRLIHDVLHSLGLYSYPDEIAEAERRGIRVLMAEEKQREIEHARKRREEATRKEKIKEEIKTFRAKETRFVHKLLHSVGLYKSPEEKEREKRAKEMKEKEEAKLRAEEEAKKAKEMREREHLKEIEENKRKEKIKREEKKKRQEEQQKQLMRLREEEARRKAEEAIKKTRVSQEVDIEIDVGKIQAELEAEKREKEKNEGIEENKRKEEIKREEKKKRQEEQQKQLMRLREEEARRKEEQRREEIFRKQRAAEEIILETEPEEVKPTPQLVIIEETVKPVQAAAETKKEAPKTIEKQKTIKEQVLNKLKDVYSEE